MDSRITGALILAALASWATARAEQARDPRADQLGVQLLDSIQAAPAP